MYLTFKSFIEAIQNFFRKAENQIIKKAIPFKIICHHCWAMSPLPSFTESVVQAFPFPFSSAAEKHQVQYSCYLRLFLWENNSGSFHWSAKQRRRILQLHAIKMIKGERSNWENDYKKTCIILTCALCNHNKCHNSSPRTMKLEIKSI